MPRVRHKFSRLTPPQQEAVRRLGDTWGWGEPKRPEPVEAIPTHIPTHPHPCPLPAPRSGHPGTSPGAPPAHPGPEAPRPPPARPAAHLLRDGSEEAGGVLGHHLAVQPQAAQVLVHGHLAEGLLPEVLLGAFVHLPGRGGWGWGGRGDAGEARGARRAGAANEAPLMRQRAHLRDRPAPAPARPSDPAGIAPAGAILGCFRPIQGSRLPAWACIPSRGERLLLHLPWLSSLLQLHPLTAENQREHQPNGYSKFPGLEASC